MFNLCLNNSKISRLIISKRLFNSLNDEITPVLTNRNPRNLERLRIGYKPDGYHLEKPGRSYWHKLCLTTSGRNVTATLKHYKNGDVLTASTKEWAVKKQLYRTNDTAAFINVGRIFAQRCLESGLTEIRCDIEPKCEGKVSAFLQAVKDGGVCLKEPDQYKKPLPWDLHRPEKPWEVTE